MMKSTTQRVFCRILALFSLVLSSLATAQVFDTEETVSYYHVNLQGAPIASTDESAAIKWTQSYSAFGYHEPNSDRLIEPNSVRFGLAGHVEDQYEGRLLVYMQGRYYDPQIGRFLSMDPVGFMESNPQSFNRYAYGNNNPARFIDPDGQVPVETLWDIANIGIGVVSLGTNLISGNFAGAAVDLGGIVLDTASAIVPYVPGGAGVANKTRRAAEAAAGVTKKADFTVTPDGVAIPNDPSTLRKGLDNLQDVSTNPSSSRKFLGEDANGPLRVRIEKAHPSDPNFTGTPDPLHTVDHLHIDRRKNVTSGPWKSKEKVQYDWPFD